MAKVTLRDITSENWRECAALQAADDLPIAPNAHALAQACYEPDQHLVPLGVYAGGQMVGFAMYGTPGDAPLYAITHLMIDQRFGGIYERAALEVLIKRLSALPDCDMIFASYPPEHSRLAALYGSVGFVDEGMRSGSDVVVRLPINQ
ncbi:MAG: GNAT family N-acetyltransferase [Anaerolineae bacterium]